VCEHVFVTGRGRSIPRPRVLLALDRRDLDWIRRNAEELAPINLGDALRICLIVRDREPDRYEKAAVRWLGRFALEAPRATVEELRLAAEALEWLPEDAEGGTEQLASLARRHSLSGW
jgi:hypothetical protein